MYWIFRHIHFQNSNPRIEGPIWFMAPQMGVYGLSSYDYLQYWEVGQLMGGN